MTNRDKLLNMSLYDFLISINQGYDMHLCIIENLTNEYKYDKEKYRCISSADSRKCSECIRHWLNEGDDAKKITVKTE